MKSRIGFISNSSSSSFIVKFKDEEEDLYLGTEETGHFCEQHEINERLVRKFKDILTNMYFEIFQEPDPVIMMNNLRKLMNSFTVE